MLGTGLGKFDTATRWVTSALGALSYLLTESDSFFLLEDGTSQLALEA